MHVISHNPFNEAIKRFPLYEDALIDLLNLLEKTAFSDPGEMKSIFLHWIILSTEINGG